VGTLRDVVAQQLGERLWDVGGSLAEQDAHAVGLFVDDVQLERRDLDQWLGVEQEQHAGDAVGEGLAGPDEQLIDPCQSLVLGERRAGARGAVLHSDFRVQAGLLGDDEEGADRGSGGWAGGEPLVDVGLGAGRRSPLVGVVEPDEELDRLGDLLLGRVHRPAGRCTGGGFGADAAQVVPGGEVLDGLAYLVGHPVNLVTIHCSKRAR
jgi:hypothetical protein